MPPISVVARPMPHGLAQVYLAGLPPSAQTVYWILRESGPLTHRQLVAASGLPPRTVRYGVAKLRLAGILGERCNLMDCRQCFFFINSTCPGGPEERAKRRLEGLAPPVTARVRRR